MFHDIPAEIGEQMKRLEAADARDRADGTPRFERLRQITPETGRFIALLAASAPKGDIVEIGTSAGYSALWLALAARYRQSRIITFETLEKKTALARETFAAAGVDDIVELRHADAREQLAGLGEIAFCFLDAEKEHYADCYELVVPHLLSGGWLVADNVISHAEQLQPFVDHAMNDPRVDSLVVPVGRGELICRKL